MTTLALSLIQYPQLLSYLAELSPPYRRDTLRALCRTDLYFLIRYILNRPDLEHPWLHARCSEIQAAPDGHLDLWARGHYKSTVITYAKTIQDILASHGDDPLPEWRGLEPTFGIFSHTRPIAKAFLRQIKRDLEDNIVLKELFPDVLWEKASRDAPQWSEDTGIVVRRRSNPKEATIEAWGLVDGQPISKHFNVLVYDDVVTRESVNTPDMVRKTTEAWELSLNLGDNNPRTRMIGTRYSYQDTYHHVIKRGALKPRLHPATVDGTLNGEPVLLTRAELETKIQNMGPYTASAQLMQNPTADSANTISREWLLYYQNCDNWQSMNRALLVDPANSKKRSSDYTAMAVMAKAEDGNLYLLDAVRDRLNLTERAQLVMQLHRKWRPQVVGYEAYGVQADVTYIQQVQERENYRFPIVEVGGKVGKTDRINRLIPYLSAGRLYLPATLWRTLHDGRTVDVVSELVEQEMLGWPFPVHDDLLDAMSRIEDVSLNWPEAADQKPRDRYVRKARSGSWMAT